MKVGRQPLEYCATYHCAGDCGLPHNQREMVEFMSECTTKAQCTDEEYQAARAAGLLVVTTEDERALHAFAESIRTKAFRAGYSAAIEFIATGESEQSGDTSTGGAA